SPLEEAFARLFDAEKMLFLGLFAAIAALYVAFRSGHRLFQIRVADSLRSSGPVEIVKPDTLTQDMPIRLELPGSNTGRAISASIVSQHNGLIELDCPGNGAAPALRPGTPIHAVVSVESALLCFETRIKDIRPGAGGFTIFITLPPSLFRLQRREYFRVPVSLPAVVSVCGNSALNDLLLRGKLEDLSGGGFRVALPARLERGDCVQVVFQDSGLRRVAFKALVLSGNFSNRTDTLPFVAQCEFTDIDDCTRNEVINYC